MHLTYHHLSEQVLERSSERLLPPTGINLLLLPIEKLERECGVQVGGVGKGVDIVLEQMASGDRALPGEGARISPQDCQSIV